MAAEQAKHTHGQADDQAEGSPFDWWRAFDAVVWISVCVIAIIAVEWLFGRVMRERVAAEAQRFLAKANTAALDE